MSLTGPELGIQRLVGVGPDGDAVVKCGSVHHVGIFSIEVWRGP